MPAAKSYHDLHNTKHSGRTVSKFICCHFGYGVASVEPLPGDGGTLESISQVLRNGEIWSINTRILERGTNHMVVPIQMIERIYLGKLPMHIAAIQEKLALLPPYKIELGLVGIKDRKLVWGNGQGRMGAISGNELGPVYSDPPPFQKVLTQTNTEAIESLLLEAFNHLFFEMGRERRPPDLGGFPSPAPHTGNLREIRT